MKKSTSMNNSIKYTDVGGFCPNCHNHEPIGDIEVNSHINLRPDSSPEVIRINHYGLMNMESNEALPYIEIICPDCNCRMIQIDNAIAPAICTLNNSGFFTKASCDGNDSYSRGYIQLYDIHPLIELFERTRKYNEFAFTFKGSQFEILVSRDQSELGEDAITSVVFDIALNAIRPLTTDIYLEIRDIGIADKFICHDADKFIDVINNICSKIPDILSSDSLWYDKQTSMSLSQYIAYLNE